ncbi:MAG: hypothetical protein WB709_12470, partial [Solirubrobacteraceae bacterium]
ARHVGTSLRLLTWWIWTYDEDNRYYAVWRGQPLLTTWTLRLSPHPRAILVRGRHRADMVH